QLQEAIDKGNKDIASLNQQKQQLADSLKQTEDSIPGKINEVRQPLEAKIAGNEKQINDLTANYTNAQKDIADKAKQIEEINKNLAVAQSDITNKEKQISDLKAESQKEIGDKTS